MKPGLSGRSHQRQRQALAAPEPGQLYSAEAEKAVLASMMSRPEEVIGDVLEALRTEDFFVPAHKELFDVVSAMHNTRVPIDITILHQYLVDKKLADAIGSPGYLAELAANLATHLNAAAYIRIVKEKSLLRRLHQACANIVQNIADHPDNVGAVLDKAEQSIVEVTKSGNIRGAAEIKAVRFDIDRPPPEPEIVLKIGKHRLLTAANVSVVAGGKKAGKSAAIAGALAALLDAPGADTLGFVANAPEGKAILYVDTEMSPHDHYAFIHNVLRRAGIDKPPPCLIPLRFKRFNIQKRRKLISESIRLYKEEFGGIQLAIIDGVADLCRDVNDPIEANELVDELMNLAEEYNCPILTVLHENPGKDSGGKTRGHLGSQLERKAESNIRIEKDKDGISTIYTESSRHCFIPKQAGFCFKWNNEHNMHMSVEPSATSNTETQLARPSYAEKDRTLIQQVFAGRSVLCYKDICVSIQQIRGIQQRGAEKVIERLQKDLIKQDVPGGLYRVA